MIITGIFHAAIKTNDLKATVDFYTKVLGLREAPRPDFGYPGAWLACPTPGGDAIIHIYPARADLRGRRRGRPGPGHERGATLRGRPLVLQAAGRRIGGDAVLTAGRDAFSGGPGPNRRLPLI